MPRRGEDGDASGEGTSWIVLRHTPAEGLGLLANALRDYGVHHRYLDVARGDALPKDIRTVGGVIVLGGPMAAYDADKHPFLETESAFVEKAIEAGRPVLGRVPRRAAHRPGAGRAGLCRRAPRGRLGAGRADRRRPGRSALRRARRLASPSSTCTATPTSCRPTRRTWRARRCTSSRRSAGATRSTASSSTSSSPSRSSSASRPSRSRSSTSPRPASIRSSSWRRRRSGVSPRWRTSRPEVFRRYFQQCGL